MSVKFYKILCGLCASYNSEQAIDYLVPFIANQSFTYNGYGRITLKVDSTLCRKCHVQLSAPIMYNFKQLAQIVSVDSSVCPACENPSQFVEFLHADIVNKKRFIQASWRVGDRFSEYYHCRINIKKSVKYVHKHIRRMDSGQIQLLLKFVSIFASVIVSRAFVDNILRKIGERCRELRLTVYRPTISNDRRWWENEFQYDIDVGSPVVCDILGLDSEGCDAPYQMGYEIVDTNPHVEFVINRCVGNDVL